MRSNALKQLFMKEFTGYFKTPLGYVFLVIFLFGLGHLTFEAGRGSFFHMREASLNSMFRYVPWMFLFLIPAVSMRLWAEERKSGTIELLLTLPLTLTQAVLAKFLAAWAFIGVGLLGTLPMVLTVFYLGNPDFAVMVMGYVASMLIAGALLAVGSFFSALTKNQVISFILTSVACLSLIMAGSPPILDFLGVFSPKYLLDVFESLSVLNHFEALERGVLGLGNLWFFAVMIACWLFGNVVILSQNKAN